MPGKEPLSTTQVAEYCGVSRVAVWKWIKKGELTAHRDASGHYRIEPEAFRAFLEANGMPVDEDLLSTSKKHVLVVDDDEPVLDVVVRALRQLGAGVVLATAEDGFEAGLQTATFKPDLLVLDLMMPHMDGFQVCRVIRNNPATAHVKILIITAYGSHENIQRALDAGADDFLHKPVDIPQLQAKVRSLLNMGPGD